jgi:hypothetical protein
MPEPANQKKHQYFRVLVTYIDGETSGHRVFKDRAKAEKWAKRQQSSGVVKKVAVEPFINKREHWRLRRKSKDQS